jgi:Na+/melibiose symporter-like transporter
VCRETTELAYDSLGTEITQDEEERTQLYAYQAAMGVGGVLFVAGGNAVFAALVGQEASFKILGLSIGVGGTLSNLFMVYVARPSPSRAC